MSTDSQRRIEELTTEKLYNGGKTVEVVAMSKENKSHYTIEYDKKRVKRARKVQLFTIILGIVFLIYLVLHLAVSFDGATLSITFLTVVLLYLILRNYIFWRKVLKKDKDV